MANTITSFFQPKSKPKSQSSGKRNTSDDAAKDNDSKSQKKAKIAETSQATAQPKVVQDLLQHLQDSGCGDNEHDETTTCLKWSTALKKHTSRSSFASLAKFVANERASQTIFPPAHETFSCLNMTPLSSVKVVIIGQDPYHGPGQGHGLAFSVKRGVQIPPSLRNIYKEVINGNHRATTTAAAESSTKSSLDYKKLMPSHGTLTSWAAQGVLLLNTVLTVRRGHANSHKKRGWEEFTDEIVRILNKEMDGLVFLLWGRPAAEKGKCINRTKHVVICTSHPSPLGASKTNAPFLGSSCFVRANDELEKRGKEPIDWSIPN
uniref:Uracil-DNA glycosylase n=1 Tax=Leptocylindrus danicus TaxID=163516 RepID=A0A7S2PRN2_9STRA|mmetsp:Transcript_9603/g.14425  ORF Transcript_9603/g.14425 Transcript_9603/m.14425 type:complete len:320 (+) Transcript_9603:71-1030(+)